jgi:RHS repeat-associated protein
VQGISSVWEAHTAPNVPPSVSLTSPTGGATFNAPASITLTATASDSDGTITKVEFFHGGTNLIATVTTPPYSVLWSSVPQAAYTLTAVATDNQLASTTSSPVNVSVGPPVPQMYFIHTDHLNTPRLVANAAGQTVWLWHQAEPFGNNVPDENPSGLGTFDLPLRLAGQYFDKETNLHYNYFRDYDASLGKYLQSDPLGLLAGVNTYAFVLGDPLRYADPQGLDKTIWEIRGPRGLSDGPRNGNWCGGNWSGGWVPSLHGGASGPHGPVDSLDSCCQAHDLCWDDCEPLKGAPRRYQECRYKCNKTLVKCLDDLDPDCTKWPQQPRPGTEADSQIYADDALRYWTQEVRKYESRKPK